MSELEAFPKAQLERELFLLALRSPADLSTARLPPNHFVCALLWDAASSSVDVISDVAARLLEAGAVYVCAWGADCDRVHAIVDEVHVGDGASADHSPVVMTTAHADETLDDALWFALMAAFPDAAYEPTCRSVVAITIDNADYAAAVRSALRDPATFVRVEADDS